MFILRSPLCWVLCALALATQTQPGQSSTTPPATGQLGAASSNLPGDSLKRQGALSLARLKSDYTAASSHRDARLRHVREALAKALATALAQGHAPWGEQAECALLIHDDGFTSLARPFVARARRSMPKRERIQSRTVETIDESGHKIVRVIAEPSPLYARLCAALGLVRYTWPVEEFDDYYMWELPTWRAWELKRQELLELADDDFFTPEQLKQLKSLEEALMAEGRALREEDKKDGFAIAARKAFVRFRANNDDSNRNAEYSPAALRRPGEKFDDVWTYTYKRPFMVFIEKSPGDDPQLRAAQSEALAELLSQQYAWFRRNFIEIFGLKRVLPIDGPTVSRSGPKRGKTFETPGELAEAEGWPLEVIMLKNSETFQSLLGELGVPGARAIYRATSEQLLCWHDTSPAENDEQAWFRESALIHECFHMLSDHYAASPLRWDYKKGRGKDGRRTKEWFTTEQRARFCNLLIHEGLADAVAGFSKEGEGAQVKYTFGRMNRLRVKDWQGAYKQLGNQNLFRIRDLLDCVHYGQVASTGNKCWERTGMKQKTGGFPRDASIYIGVYYATAALAVSFFTDFKESGALKYREKWLAFVKSAYTGSIKLTDYSPEPGINAFKDAFGLTTDEEFEKLEAEFVLWAQNLKVPE